MGEDGKYFYKPHVISRKKTKNRTINSSIAIFDWIIEFKGNKKSPT